MMQQHSSCKRKVAAVVLACSGMLGPLGLAHAQDSVVTRVVEFTYDPTHGQVLTETVDPGGSHCVKTTHVVNAYGNRDSTKVEPCVATQATAFAPRLVTNLYQAGVETGNTYPAGAYLTQSSASVINGATTTVLSTTRTKYSAAHGTATSKTEVAIGNEARNLTKRAEYDAFGRVRREYTPVQVDAGVVKEAYVQHNYANYCQGSKAPATPAERAAAGCIDFTLTVPVNYASGRLTNSATGSTVTTATVLIKTAYFIESTPYSPTGTVIGARTRVHFDALHREIAKETEAYDKRWVRVLTGYDALGNVAANWTAHFVAAGSPNTLPPDELRQWTVARDLLHRPTEQAQYWRGKAADSAQQISSLLSYQGLRSEAIVPAGSSPNGVERKATTIRNAAGQVAQTINADGATLNMAYDGVGNLVKSTDALTNGTTIEYTPTTARFKTRMVEPNQHSRGWVYEYDALGQMVKQTDARGVVTTMAYDGLGRMTQKASADLTSIWYFDKTEAGVVCAYGLARLCESKASGSGTTVTREALQYDLLARAEKSKVTAVEKMYETTTLFDSLGRIDSLVYPTGYKVKHAYTPEGAAAAKLPGVLESVSGINQGSTTGTVLWSVSSLTAAEVFNARGALLKASLGNGMVVQNSFDSISGKAFQLTAGTVAGGSTNALNHKYEYDKAHNVTRREDALKAITETYLYDVLDRLTRYTLDSGQVAANRTVNAQYNALGNVLAKSDVGSYTYLQTRPHGVASAGGSTYSYDDNGNLTSATGVTARTNTFTSFNLPNTLASGGNSVQFWYDAGHKRVKEVITSGSTVRTQFMVHPNNAGGLGFEQEIVKLSGSVTRNENRHYITVGGTVVAVVKTFNANSEAATLNGVVNSSSPNDVNYWHKDALGSVVAVSNAAGTVIEKMAFDAWGLRMSEQGFANTNINPAHGDRGFTGHEHLDELGLVHMNARMYDPVLGRFLSVDPVIQDVTQLQMYNGYSYVTNNPLKYTDPTGAFLDPISGALLQAFIGTVMMAEGNKYWKIIGQILTLDALGGDSPLLTTDKVLNSMIAAGYSAAVTTNGNIEAIVQGAFFGGMFTSIGGIQGLETWQKVFLHAAVGCFQGAASGGSCGPSAVAAGFSKWATLTLFSEALQAPKGTVERLQGAFLAAAVGGTASVIGGGKFANGAVQGAFGYLFNQVTQGPRGALRTAYARYEVTDNPYDPNAAFVKDFAGSELERRIYMRILEIHSGQAAKYEDARYTDSGFNLPKGLGGKHTFYHIYTMDDIQKGVPSKYDPGEIRIARDMGGDGSRYLVSLKHYSFTVMQPMAWTKFNLVKDQK